MARRTAEPVPPRPPGRAGRGRPAAGDTYQSALAARYASQEMIRLWSPRTRCATYRRIWIALAEAQRELGLPISPGQIRAMRRAAEDIDFAALSGHERRTRHEVMAHIHAFGEAAPAARGIIHLGATSMDIVDNADLMLIRAALELLIGRLAAALGPLADFCERYADLPALGLTHLQPAQLTTVGKRGCLWLADLLADLERLAALRGGLRCRGLRGSTGTQASFLELLGSAASVRRLERSFAGKLGFDDCYPVCGQTYSRKVDVEIVSGLCSFAAGAQKTCNDLRLLALLGEIEEPFERAQVGSSAMPYKRNPVRCERATGLSRYLLSLASSPPMTLAAQAFERTLDDSSTRRLVIPQAFLTADAIIVLLHTIFEGLVVYPPTIAARVEAELPLIASEAVLMEAVRRGGDRQELHERIRRHARKAAEQVRKYGRRNDLIDRLQSDPAFKGVRWSRLLDPQRHVGLAPQQAREFIRRRVRPALRRYRPAGRPELRV